MKGASVLVFDHQRNKGVRVDEESIRSLHEALGTKIGSRMFIVAPAMVFDFQQDYVALDGVRYYALRIPYSIIHELHKREFSALRQPVDEMAVNDTVDAVGFDFIRVPELEYAVGSRRRKGEFLTEAFIRIDVFKSEAVVRDSNKSRANRESLSMVLLDFDYAGAGPFEFDEVAYAERIAGAQWEISFPIERLGKNMMAVFVDIYGNEAREIIPASKFGGSRLGVSKSSESKQSKKKAKV